MITRNRREMEMIRRFRQVVQFVPPKVLEDHLHALESYALANVELNSSSSTDSEEGASSEIESTNGSQSVGSPHTMVSNPPKRSPKRMRLLETGISDSDDMHM